MALKYEVIAKNGTYQKDGQEKTRWLRCGSCFETERGLSIKIDALPVGFDGWLTLAEPENRTAKAKQSTDDFPPF